MAFPSRNAADSSTESRRPHQPLLCAAGRIREKNLDSQSANYYKRNRFLQTVGASGQFYAGDGCARANCVMRRMSLAGLAAGAVRRLRRRGAGGRAWSSSTTIDLDYIYSQENVGGDVNATTQFNQKYEIKYETSLTTAYDFLGAVRLDLQDAWYTDQAATSRVAPTLEMAAKGSQLAAKLAYEAVDQHHRRLSGDGGGDHVLDQPVVRPAR